MEPSDYPVTFSVDYPDRKLNRLTTFFRIFTVIPIAIVSVVLTGGSIWSGSWIWDITHGAGAGLGLVTVPVLLMILFRQKYPRWWFDWNLEILRFGNRIGIYMALMDDDYPSTDEQQSVHLDFLYPDVENDLGRGMPIVKWFLAILTTSFSASSISESSSQSSLPGSRFCSPAVIPGALHPRRGGLSLAEPGGGLCLCSGDGSLSAFPTLSVEVRLDPHGGGDISSR
jgi:hypothetical protein